MRQPLHSTHLEPHSQLLRMVSGWFFSVVHLFIVCLVCLLIYCYLCLLVIYGCVWHKVLREYSLYFNWEWILNKIEYTSRVRSCLICGSETWPMKVDCEVSFMT